MKEVDVLVQLTGKSLIPLFFVLLACLALRRVLNLLVCLSLSPCTYNNFYFVKTDAL